MGDGDTPKNPADKPYKDAPQGLRDFLNCVAASYTWTDGEARWIPDWPVVRIQPGPVPSSATLELDFGEVVSEITLAVDGGTLSLDPSALARDKVHGKAVGWFVTFVANANAWLLANGKELGPLLASTGRLTLAKRPVDELKRASQPPVVGPGSQPTTDPKPDAGKPPETAPDAEGAPPLPWIEDRGSPKGSTSPVARGAAHGADAAIGAGASFGAGGDVSPVAMASVSAAGYAVAQAEDQQGDDEGGPSLLQGSLSGRFLAALAGVAAAGVLAGALVGNAGILTAAVGPTPSHRSGGVENPTPAASEPEATGPEASGDASAEPTSEPGPTAAPVPTQPFDLSKVAFQMILQASSDQVDFHCRILVRADVNVQALGTSAEEDQAIVDAIVGQTAIVEMSGPGLPKEVKFPIGNLGSNDAIFGDITKATSGAGYTETLVSVGGLPLNLKSETFVNPCTN